MMLKATHPRTEPAANAPTDAGGLASVTALPPRPAGQSGGREPNAGGYRLQPAFYEPARVPAEVDRKSVV